MVEITKFKLQLVKEETVKYKTIGEQIQSPSDIFSIATDILKIHSEVVESTWMLTLDTKSKITGIFEISRGTLDASILHPRDVFQRAILQNSSSIILFHNHPSGDTKPSKNDIETTKQIRDAGNFLGIKLIDHVIIGDNYYSMAEYGDIY